MALLQTGNVVPGGAFAYAEGALELATDWALLDHQKAGQSDPCDDGKTLRRGEISGTFVRGMSKWKVGRTVYQRGYHFVLTLFISLGVGQVF